MTDYTTLQYHLANKTHIEFTIKVISGIIGVVLNFILIPKMGLIGVGLATFAANFLYWLLSVIIVLPDLNLTFPKNTVLRMIITAVPVSLVLLIIRKYDLYISASFQMIALLLLFYLTYYVVCKRVIKNSD
jgi:O-antigen/teichoic acid export membrane protein